MNNLLYVIPECYADTNLISALVHTEVNHQKGCNQVAMQMQQKFTDRFAVGVIDYDKKIPGYLNEMSMLAKTTHLRLYQHPTKPHYIITIQPAIEQFVLSCAEELGVNLLDYHVASSLEGLKKQTKRVDSNRDPVLRNLFNALQRSSEMIILRNTLEYLNQSQYKADDDRLKAIFG